MKENKKVKNLKGEIWQRYKDTDYYLSNMGRAKEILLKEYKKSHVKKGSSYMVIKINGKQSLKIGVDYSMSADQTGLTVTFKDRYRLIAFVIENSFNNSKYMPRKKKKKLRKQLFKNFNKKKVKKIKKHLKG